MRDRRLWIVAVGGALAFGVAAGLVHGNAGGFRGALGNLSAPWLLVALVPAWRAGSWLRGALLGTATTLVALAGFYVGLTVMMSGHLGDVVGPLPSFELVVRANVLWFMAGLASGPVMGAVGGALGRRVGDAWLALGAAALLVGEMFVVEAVADVSLPVVHLAWSVGDLRGYATEAVTGALLAVGALWTLRRPAT